MIYEVSRICFVKQRSTQKHAHWSLTHLRFTVQCSESSLYGRTPHTHEAESWRTNRGALSLEIAFIAGYCLFCQFGKYLSKWYKSGRWGKSIGQVKSEDSWQIATGIHTHTVELKKWAESNREKKRSLSTDLLWSQRWAIMTSDPLFSYSYSYRYHFWFIKKLW